MTETIKKIAALVLAFSLLMFVFVPSFAEDTAEEPEDEDEFYTFDDDYCGHVDEDRLAEFVPEITDELKFSDDLSGIPETEPEADTAEPEEEPAEAAEEESEAEVEEPEEEPAEAAEEEPEAEAEEPEEEPEEAAEVPEETAEVTEEEPEIPEEVPAEKPASEEEPAAEEPETALNVQEEAAEQIPEAEEPDTEIISEAETASEPETQIPDPVIEETPDEEETEPDAELITVTIETNMISEDEMQLNAVVNGPEGNEFAYQWQISEDGENFTDIEEETEDMLQVLLTEENRHCSWRVRVDTI